MNDWKKRPGQFRRDDRRGGPARERRADGPYAQLLYGFHSVREALDNPTRRLVRLMVTENALSRLKESGPLPIEPEIVRPDAIGRLLTPDAVHQGVLLEAEPPAAPALSALPGDALLLALDQITDPHNVGAILRSAAAFGVTAVIVTLRHAPEVTGVLAKAASGALEHVPLIPVRNLVKTLEELAERGYQRIGLDSEAPESIDVVTLRRPSVIVLGAEGKGLRQSTRAACDVMARLDLPGEIKSLNVSNAAAVTLYALTRRAAA
jgi:23S rRNA (guanosine2251-2'-O)-methyltransferase